MRSLKSHLCCGAMLMLLGFVASTPAPAFATGVPIQFTIDPGSIRQGEKREGAALATVILKSPSPIFFVCRIRSSETDKIHFANIIFKKGQLKGTAQGTVDWPRVLKDTNVKVSAFSVDAPGDKLWFTVTLKVKDDETENQEGQALP